MADIPDLGAQMPLNPDLGGDEGPRGAKKQVRVTPAHLGVVVLGGTVGTAAREALTLSIPNLGSLPLATMVINISGAFALGLLLETLVRRGDDTGKRRTLRLFFGTGALGGFTTYSALALDTQLLLADGLLGAATVNGAGTLVVGFIAAWAGIIVASRVHDRRQVGAP